MTIVHSGDLDLLERLGGSRATVHRAVVRTSGRVVVVKHATWDRPDVVATLGREASILRRVTRRGLVRLLACVEDDRGRSLVLEHAPGGCLEDVVARHGPMGAQDVAELGAVLADTLAALHRSGVVHRDVHPGNVLLDAELLPVLADLDHAIDHHGDPLPVDDEVVGRPAHVDPRLLAGATPSPSADVHGLATTLWVLATGVPPPRRDAGAPVVFPPDGRVPAPLLRVLTDCVTRSVDDAEAVAGALRGAALELAAHRDDPSDEGLRSLAPPHPTPSSPTPQGPRAGGTDRGTRRWGPVPVRPTPAVSVAVSSPRRSALTLAVALGIMAVLLTVLAPRGRSTPVVVAPPPCSPTDSAHATVWADLDGDGCSEPLHLSEGVLSTPFGDYELGSPGDVLVAGDWDGDGTWTPGLYRPSTGAAFLFDGPPGTTAVTSRPAVPLEPGGTVRVVDRDGDGRHELEVAARPT